MAAKSSTAMNTTMFCELRENDKAVDQFVPMSGRGVSKGDMSMSVKIIQILSLLCAVIGVIGLGVEIFINEIGSITMLYICSAFTFIGLLSNAIAAVYRLMHKQNTE